VAIAFDLALFQMADAGERADGSEVVKMSPGAQLRKKSMSIC